MLFSPFSPIPLSLSFCLMNSFNFWQSNVQTKVTVKEGTGHAYWWFGRKKPKLLRQCRSTPACTLNLGECMLAYLCIVFTTNYRLLFMRHAKITRAEEQPKGRIKLGFDHCTGRKQTLDQKYRQYVSKKSHKSQFQLSTISSRHIFPFLPEFPKK